MILEPFGGIGGFSEALRMHGRDDSFLIESAPPAVRIARLNGHTAVLADVTRFSPWKMPEGIAAGPPCQGFSPAGKGVGRVDIPLILDAARAMATARYPHVVLTEIRKRTADHRSALVLEPWRLFLQTRPSWMVLEQVPAILPLWELLAELARDMGYRAWSGIVRAEQFDVAQTRRRAALLLRIERLQAEMLEPIPVRSRYYERSPERIDPGMPRWLSMAETLGRGVTIDNGNTRWLRSNYGTGGNPANRGKRSDDQPAPAVTGKAGRNKWSDGGRLTVREAATLQSFRPDFQLAGTLGEQYQAIGNAIPPMLAYHLFKGVL